MGVNYTRQAPFSAGYCAIMAGIDDIFACGGTPIAASCIVSSDSKETRNEILKGLIRASNEFRVPIVRGHTGDDSPIPSVSATLIGKIKKKYYISASNSKLGDNILIISDFEGKIGKYNKFHWDTITIKKDPSVLLKKRSVMNELAKKNLLHASKDISNGGIFGTLLLMLDYSKKGAIINIDNIELPPLLRQLNYSVLDYAKMYLTTAFLVTAAPKNLNKITNVIKNYDMSLSVIGKVIEETKIFITNNSQEKRLLFDQADLNNAF
ncbi:MAG: AIR synthase-related protein [Promethearchaeota archaeon]